MFEVGHLYRRRQLHETYGGQEQGGISTPRHHRLIFLFTGDVGTLYGYQDHWDDDGVFHLTGEGQIGDMEMLRGNRAIRDHARDGKALHLFQIAERGCVRYIGEFAYVDHDLMPNVPDRRGGLRTAIVFRLVPAEQDFRKLRAHVDQAVKQQGHLTERLRPHEVSWQGPGLQLSPENVGVHADEPAIVFEPGKRYRNRRGSYRIIAVNPPRMQIRYDDGELAEVDIAIQERILTNMRAKDRNIKPLK